MTEEEICVRTAVRRKDLKRYINLPYNLYRNDTGWAPQIRVLERMEYYSGTNPVFSRSNYRLFIAENRSGTVVGRVIAYIDPRYNSYHRSNFGFFGSFEADGPAAASALHTAVETWMRGNLVESILGPIDPVAECWGFTVEGFDYLPVFMSPYNPPEYGQWAESAGYTGTKDLLVYEVHTGSYDLPDRYSRFERLIALKRPELRIRSMNIRNLKSDARILLDLLNRGVEGNWGFTPVGEDELDSLITKLKLIADPDAIWFVEDAGTPVGCALGFPDLNMVLRKTKGRLLPFGWIRLLRATRTCRDYRLWALAVLPEYRGLGLDVLLYTHLYRALKPRGIRLEANYVLEDNARIVNALEKLGMKRIKRYRVYRKNLEY